MIFAPLKTGVSWFFRQSIVVKIGMIALVTVVGWFGYTKLHTTTSSAPIYQTQKVARGTLVVSLTASGNVSTANSASVTTEASGVVKKVHVENGQEVKVGDPIAELDLDLDGRQRSTQAYASYQSAKNNVDSAQANLFSSQSTLFTQWKTYMDLAESSTYQNADGSPVTDKRTLPKFMSTQDDWYAAEAKFKVQQATIIQAQTSLSSAWSTYQKTSPVIYAPISGTVNGLSLQIGSVLTAQSGSSGNATAQKIASILTDAPPTVTVSLTEVDVPKVKIGNKVNLTFDAFPGKTYTGKIVSLDTVGSVSSGVTTYPAIIKLDIAVPGLLTNMSAQAHIITDVRDNALIVPSTALQTATDGTSYVRLMNTSVVENAPVEIGVSSATDTEILSGIQVGDTVVTSVSQTAPSTTSTSTTSVFSRIGGGMGGGAVRTGGR